MEDLVDSFWADRPVLVTGGTGLLGSWVLKRLIEKGADVVCLVRDWVPRLEVLQHSFVEHLTIVRGEVQDQAVMERALGEYEVDTVFHLAAQALVPIANRNPVSTFDSNIRGTWTVLEACRRSPAVRQVVVASSDKAYGNQTTLPYNETMPLQGKYPYDVSKSCADLICQSYAATYGLPVAVTRCGNFFGGGDLNWNRIVPGTIRSIFRGQKPLIRSDGGFVRDYFYVEDGAAAYMLLAERLAGDRTLVGHAFNFSTEIRVTVLELVHMLLKIMKSDLEPEVLNQVSNEIRNQFLSAAKARDMLCWSPLFALEEGLQRTVAWYGQYFGISKKSRLVEIP